MPVPFLVMSSRPARKAARARDTWGFTELTFGGIHVPVEGTMSIKLKGGLGIVWPNVLANQRKRERRARRRAD